jgi:hypothetical protein
MKSCPEAADLVVCVCFVGGKEFNHPFQNDAPKTEELIPGDIAISAWQSEEENNVVERSRYRRYSSGRSFQSILR